MYSRHTLNGRLGTGGGDGAHGPDHEVGEEQVRVGAALVDVVAEVGDLGGRGLALEGARVGGTGGIVELGGRAQGAGGVQVGAGSRYAAREGAGSDCERCHDVVGDQLVVVGRRS